MANLDRIREVVQLIQDDFDQFDGKHFDMSQFVEPPPEPDMPAFCNTAMCFAGWTMVHQHGMAAFLEKALTRINPYNDGEKWSSTPWADSIIEKEAVAYLGITWEEGEAIFYRTSIETVDALKQRITDVLEETIWEGVLPRPLTELRRYQRP